MLAVRRVLVVQSEALVAMRAKHAIRPTRRNQMSYQFSPLDLKDGERIADAVMSRLRRAIARHDLQPGFHLSVPSLAAQMGTSRSPVHEAVKRLVQEGLATEEPRRGAFVTAYNPPALIPLYEVRYVLEGFAAGLAAERAGSEAIRQMEAVLDQEATAIARDDLEAHIDIDIQFHEQIVAAAANPALEEMLGQVHARIRSAMLSRIVPTGPEQALADHRAVLEAIKRRNSLAADQAAREHVMRVYTKLVGQRVMASAPMDSLAGAPYIRRPIKTKP